ncbi:T9SS type A sorting domain-containing protein [Hymenobacter busanensis]|uniref:T9SS type A sorting domain-containing protein n=1 Tax=Hymenobacter busanensis TaxID=2607656 RepID=A0A7L5A2Z5_9BACT|nr:T9SS type A sorting domain-containing protein [Hymenobacter busanensis]KAA9333134.1 T9SS type A sorting domain-containing protein [Hymenobacter busanensis]QHJ08190.1 T9SS type A sorting domain-containing protein [Hymenobacter busanensis]
MDKTCTLLVKVASPRARRWALMLMAWGSSVAPVAAQSTPAFPRNETFKNAAASNFTFGGSAQLTGVGGNGNDAVGAGYLRLTDATTNQAGYAIDNVGFPAGAGFTISFEFFSYGKSTTDGADGFSVFLVDGNQPGGFRIGASGGSLGYAQKTVSPAAAGVSRGYIGIGIDEFGNYSNGSEGRSGGSSTLDASGKAPNAIAIRGAGDGSATTDYPYLTGTGPDALGFDLDVATARAQAGSADYRRAFIDVVPTTTGSTTTYRITVRIQHGSAIRTAIDNFAVPAPPQNLRLGFAGSTGGSTNVHEIRNLNIVQVPFANTDVASTPYNSPVTLNVLNNDVAPGSSIDVASVDLDPNTAGRQTTLTVAGQGSFAVDNSGVVTFTPSGSFAGTVVVPYTMQSILGPDYTSSPANMRVTVQGADVATAVSGPANAAAGARVTYAMSTQNQGAVTAMDVAPKLRLPAGLPTGSVTGGTYDPSTGWVTFARVTSMVSNAPAVTNSVTFTAPVTGPVTGLASATSLVVPDPTPANNNASVTTAISGNPLPVVLTRFEAVAQAADAVLTWGTAQEKNNDHFDVERSANGRDFEKVGRVAGHGSTSNSSDYKFRDAGAGRLHFATVYYRLRQVDTDGTSDYSGIQVVQFSRDAAGPDALALYPNPAAGHTTLDLTALPAGTYTVRVLDLTGRVVRTHTLAGAAQHPLDVQRLQAGAYVVQVSGHGVNRTLPLVAIQ